MEIEADLAAPTVHFGIPGKQRVAVLVLHLPKGKLSYWEGFGPTAKRHTTELSAWRLAFRVNLDFQAIAAEHVKGSAAIPAEVKKHLEEFSPDGFTIIGVDSSPLSRPISATMNRTRRDTSAAALWS